MKISIILTIIFLLLNPVISGQSSTKGKVIEIDPGSLQYLSNTFDQILVFFLDQPNPEYQQFFEQHIKDINQTYPNDQSLYAITYFKNDTLGKLSKFNNKSDGFRIITRRNHYQMEFNHQVRQFQLLKKFYATYIHPVLPILVKEQYGNIETQNFIVMEYNSDDKLKNYIKIYPKLYDYLKIFNVRAIATESTKNQSKVQLFSKSKMDVSISTYAGQTNNTEEILEWINVETLKPLTKLDDENYVRIFGSQLDTQFLLIYDQKDSENKDIQQVCKHLTQAAIYNKQEQLKYQRILFAQSSIQFLSKYFDSSIQQLQDQKGNKLLYRLIMTKTDYGNFQLRRFNYNEEIHGKPNKQNIMKFIEDVRMKRLDSEEKSQKIPAEEEQQKNILRKIVGKSFIKQVFQRPNQSVIVLFIDSKDENSYKDVKKVLQEFSKKYKQVLNGKVITSYFDLALNQNKLLSIRTAPLLALFEKTNKKSPKYFKGYPKVEAIKGWVNYEVKDITIPQNYGQKILPLGGSTPTTQRTQKVSTQL